MIYIGGMIRVDRQRRNGSECWNGEVGGAVAENKKTFEEWLQRRDRVTYDRYRAQRVLIVKPQVNLQKEWRTGDGQSEWTGLSLSSG